MKQYKIWKQKRCTPRPRRVGAKIPQRKSWRGLCSAAALRDFLRFWGATIVLLVFAGMSQAQTPLALDEALHLARQNNLQLQKQQQKQRIAELEVAINRGQRLPALDLSATTSYTDEVARLDIPLDRLGLPLPSNAVQPRIELGGHDRTDIAVGVRQPIFTGSRLSTQVELAQTAFESEQTRLEVLQQQTAYQVYLLFYQAQSLKKERKIQEASLSRLSVQLQQTRNLFSAAQAMAYDTLQVYNQWMGYGTVGVSLQWNLWRGNQDRHRVEAAEVEYNRLTLEERELLRSIDYEVERSWENAKFAAGQIELAERLLAQQQERYRIINAQQREGVATTNDLIVAESDLTQAEVQLQRALIQYYLAESEILLATGVIGE